MKKPLLSVFIILFVVSGFAVGTPTASRRAEKAVKGWLIRTKARPLGTPLGQMITRVDSFTDGKGEVIYHIVYLQPSGFVIVPADDLIEPIVGFASAGHYDASFDNPLGALVTQDLNARTAVVREVVNRGELHKHKSLSNNETKWRSLEYVGEQSGDSVEMGLPAISDVRVVPFVQSRWDQTTVCGNNCYNIYTPNNYSCGCVATATVQLMRYYQHPVGTYSWTDMVLIPDCSTTLIQREAIGILCYDAAEAVNTDYGPDGSAADTLDSADAFVNTFNYDNAVKGYNSGNNIGTRLNGMLNPNLDAGYPCLLGITGTPGGHAVVCDGYGYNSSTLYHHLNMGWSGTSDAWYNLPNIDNTAVGNFNSVYKCVYNIYTTGAGEIISGRVTDAASSPISGAAVTATRNGGGTYNTTTNIKGIYALAKIPSDSNYTITVGKPGYSFAPQSFITLTSTDNSNTSGNVWGANFEGSAKYSGGTGTPDDPYRIATPEDMQRIGANPSHWNKCFILVNDVNLAQYTGTQFNKIGTDWINAFTGVFDGNDCKVWNFTWTSNAIDDVGLFGYVGSVGQIKNLRMENVNVNAGTGEYVGGLVGWNDGTITNCYSTGSVSGYWGVGGLAGENDNTIANCYSTGNVSGNLCVGGLVGENDNTIANCYSTGSISGNWGVGGLVGENDNTIANCYSTGSVSGNYDVGGLVGYDEGGEVAASFWDIETSSQSTSAGGTPKTTAEMKTKSTFTNAGWDFGNIWDICEGTSYPRLRWQILSARDRGDFLCPYGVDFLDFAVLASAWQSEPGDPDWNPSCDISKPKDNFINELDLAILCENWLKDTGR
jgi:hypothetical protein